MFPFLYHCLLFSMSGSIIFTIVKYTRMSKYKLIIYNLKQNCLGLEPKTVALSLTLGFCVGIIPLLGVTFITITALGVLLKLNQVILHSIHLLITPLQIILIPVFIKAGLLLFNQPDASFDVLTHEILHSNFLEILQKMGFMLLYGLATWLILAVAMGLILYRVLLVVLLRRKVKAMNNASVLD